MATTRTATFPSVFPTCEKPLVCLALIGGLFCNFWEVSENFRAGCMREDTRESMIGIQRATFQDTDVLKQVPSMLHLH